jgi:hypothetical protein
MSNTVRGFDRDEWLTREDLAQLMGRNIDTVRRVQRENALRTQTGNNGATLLRVGDLIDLGRIPASVLDPEVSARDVADAIALRRELEQVRAERCELAGRLAGYEERVRELQAHIATLNTLVGVLGLQSRAEVTA